MALELSAGSAAALRRPQEVHGRAIGPAEELCPQPRELDGPPSPIQAPEAPVIRVREHEDQRAPSLRAGSQDALEPRFEGGPIRREEGLQGLGPERPGIALPRLAPGGLGCEAPVLPRARRSASARPERKAGSERREGGPIGPRGASRPEHERGRRRNLAATRGADPAERAGHGEDLRVGRPRHHESLEPIADRDVVPDRWALEPARRRDEEGCRGCAENESARARPALALCSAAARATESASEGKAVR